MYSHVSSLYTQSTCICFKQWMNETLLQNVPTGMTTWQQICEAYNFHGFHGLPLDLKNFWFFPIEYGHYIVGTVIHKNYFRKMFRLSRKLCASTIIWCYVVFKNYQSKWWLSLLIRKPLKHFASWSENFAPIEECLLENISERLFASWSENFASRTIPAY